MNKLKSFSGINYIFIKRDSFLNEDKANIGEFLPIGWEAKENDEQPEWTDEDDGEDPEIMFGSNLSCPMVFWESEEKIDSWIRGQLNEHENVFKGTPLSYMVSTDN